MKNIRHVMPFAKIITIVVFALLNGNAIFCQQNIGVHQNIDGGFENK